METTLWIIILLGGASALLYVWHSIKTIMAEESGSDRMIEIASAIKSGAKTFLKREYRNLAFFTAVVALSLGLFVEPRPWVAASYLFGTVLAASIGWIGMTMATEANSRTTHAAMSKWSRGLEIAFSSGAVMGFGAVGLGVIGLAILGMAFPGIDGSKVWLGFAFGSSAVALFLRVGGGVFTKSADVGADLVGKVEKGIPEDDDRNAASIADNVGDIVGDIAGMGSDLFESYVSTIAAAMVLGILSAEVSEFTGFFMPLTLAAVGIFTSIIGAMLVKPKREADSFADQVSDAHSAMNRGVSISNIIMVAAAFLVIYFFNMDDIILTLRIFGTVVAGLIAGVMISFFTEYYTSVHYGPTRNLAASARGGIGVNIIEGMSLGMMSTAAPIIVVSLATIIAYALEGLMGIAMAALGMIINLGILLSMDCFGPTADNAAGIAEMAGLGTDVRERCEALDAVGNTTAALGKGFAITSAALSALAWLATYFEVVPDLMESVEYLSLQRVDVIVGIMVGGMLTFFLSAWVMRGVGQGSFKVVEEVRRQFAEIEGIMERVNKPDYDRVVGIATEQALRTMIVPGLVTIITPLILGFVLGAASVGGLLIGSLSSGFTLAIMMANSGGAWDNAKKYIEAGHFGGKGSEAHISSVVGDTVGDPFKDTAGPSLDILIKLIGKIAVIFGSFFFISIL